MAEARMAGKVAVVTGGASGLGEATVRQIVAEGGKVVIADFQEVLAQRLAADLGADSAVAVRCDVTVEDDVAAAIDAATTVFGRIDGVFANAGIVGAVGPLADTSMADFDATMAVLLRGVFVTLKHGARALIAQGTGGSMVSTSSIAGVQGGLGPHVYSAAKSAVIGLTRSASAELVAHGIRVNAIAPGGIATPLTAAVTTGDPTAVEQTAQAIGSRSPLKRPGLPRHVSEIAVWLMSDASDYISGQTIVVDAGVTTGAGVPQFSQQAGMVGAAITPVA